MVDNWSSTFRKRHFPLVFVLSISISTRFGLSVSVFLFVCLSLAPPPPLSLSLSLSTHSLSIRRWLWHFPLFFNPPHSFPEWQRTLSGFLSHPSLTHTVLHNSFPFSCLVLCTDNHSLNLPSENCGVKKTSWQAQVLEKKAVSFVGRAAQTAIRFFNKVFLRV